MPTALTPSGCGEVSHSSDCLCDVVITEPCQVRIHPMSFDYAASVDRALPEGDWGYADDGQKLDFLEALCKAHDVLSEHDPADLAKIDDVNNVDLQLMADRVSSYLQNGGSIATAEEDLDMDWGMVKLAIATHKATGIAWRMTRADFLEFERALDELPKVGSVNLVKRFGGSSTGMRRLAKFFRGEEHFASNDTMADVRLAKV